MSEWKPCPFCGSRTIRFNKCTLRVQCAECHATGGLITKYINQGMNEEEAAKTAWNNRFKEATGGVSQ